MNKRQRKKKENRPPHYPWTRTRDGRKILSIERTSDMHPNPGLARDYPLWIILEDDFNHLRGNYGEGRTYTKDGYYINEHFPVGLDLI